MKKPISPALHTRLDYGLGALQAVLPPLIGLNRRAVKSNLIAAVPMLILDSLTDTRGGIWRKVSFRDHQKADQGFLLRQAVLTFFPYIRKNRKALIFHLAFLAVSAAQYALTDYGRQPK